MAVFFTVFPASSKSLHAIQDLASAYHPFQGESHILAFVMIAAHFQDHILYQLSLSTEQTVLELTDLKQQQYIISQDFVGWLSQQGNSSVPYRVDCGHSLGYIHQGA